MYISGTECAEQDGCVLCMTNRVMKPTHAVSTPPHQITQPYQLAQNEIESLRSEMQQAYLEMQRLLQTESQPGYIPVSPTPENP
jgi:hypothetical protein